MSTEHNNRSEVRRYKNLNLTLLETNWKCSQEYSKVNLRELDDRTI